MRQAAISEAIANAALTMGYAKVRQSLCKARTFCQSFLKAGKSFCYCWCST